MFGAATSDTKLQFSPYKHPYILIAPEMVHVRYWFQMREWRNWQTHQT
jgi:hypothetical protein